MTLVHPPLQLFAPWFIATIYLGALAYSLAQYRRYSSSRGWLWTALGVSYTVLIAQYVSVRYAILYGDTYDLANSMVVWFKLS